MARYRKEYESFPHMSRDENGVEKLTFFTTNPVEARKVMEHGAHPYRVGKIDGEEISWTFELPVEWYKTPRPKKRMSEETKAKHAARLAQMRLGDDRLPFEPDESDVLDEEEE
jgi:hypothetical protein